MTEKQIETEILTQLNRLEHTFCWKNHTMGVYDPMRRTFRKLSGFAIRGVSDILGIHKGRMICLEVKSAKGRLRPEQKEFLDKMTSLGAVCGVVRSWPDALAVLKVREPDNLDKSAL